MEAEKKNCYFYPNSAKRKPEENNPYPVKLMDGLEKNFNILNRDRPSNTGVFDFFKYLRKIDFLMLNWIEDLPDKKFGIFQTILFILLMNTKRILGLKVVWIMHNKLSHNKSNILLKKRLFNILILKSDLIITHSSEGIRYASQYSKKAVNKMLFLHHPVNTRAIKADTANKVYDILIWGIMAPYKGVLEFIKQINNYDASKYKILIAGKFTSDEYYQSVLSYQTGNITIINEFIEFEQVGEYIRQSKIVLFTYNPESVLSSGALMTTLEYPSIIIGPGSAAFADLKNDGIIFTYQKYDDLFQTIEKIVEPGYNRQDIIESQENFVKKYTWENITIEINKRILGIL